MIILYILLALFVLLMMVTIHEFGHYIAGKILGFKINEFSIGFGKAIYSHTCKSGEVFSIRIFPLGGYCAFDGEEGDGVSEGAFLKQKPWKRLIVLFNGAFFNFISAIIFCFIMLVSVGYDIPQVYAVDQVVQIDSVYEIDSQSGYKTVEYTFNNDDRITKINGEEIGNYEPKALSSLLSDRTKYTDNSYTITLKQKDVEGEKNVIVYITRKTNYDTDNPEGSILPEDVILKVNGTNIDFIKNNSLNNLIVNEVVNNKATSITVTVRRNGELLDVNLNLYNSGLKDADGNYGKAIGVKSQAYKFTVGESLIRCVPYTFGFSWKVLGALGDMITGKVGLSEIGGPVYTIGTIATLSSQSIVYFLTLLPLLSANLAIFNWLPIPALDGSKMLLTTIEWIKGKPLFNQKTENIITIIGFILLIALVVIADGYHIIFG